MALAAGCDDPRLPLLFITTRSQSQLSHHAVSVTSAFQGSDSSALVKASTPQKDHLVHENHGLVLVLEFL
jgi:hypothetical protein